MSTQRFEVDPQTLITEITIRPDGRVFVFGTSKSILEVLAQLQPQDARVKRLLEVSCGTDFQPVRAAFQDGRLLRAEVRQHGLEAGATCATGTRRGAAG